MCVPVLFEKIHLRNIFSFIDTTVELRGLNVLIGPNGVGKSNLIDVMALLHAAPTDLQTMTDNLGGIGLIVSLASGPSADDAVIDCRLRSPGELRYSLGFTRQSGPLILGEALRDDKDIYFHRSGSALRMGSSQNGEQSQIPFNQSVFAAYKNPADLTPTTEVGRSFERIRIYREFRTSGPFAPARSGVSSSAMKDFLHDGGDNLAVVLHDLDFKGVHQRVQSYLKEFCERFEDFKTRLNGPIMGAFIQEAGLREPLSAMRLSDGTLKFLCLLAVLLNPDIPPLICIEEPEVGLHPDAIRIVAQALVEASERTQLIVTTHSEALIDALSDRPEDVLVCERDFDNGTQFRRLNREQLSGWLERTRSVRSGARASWAAIDGDRNPHLL